MSRQQDRLPTAGSPQPDSGPPAPLRKESISLRGKLGGLLEYNVDGLTGENKLRTFYDVDIKILRHPETQAKVERLLRKSDISWRLFFREPEEPQEGFAIWRVEMLDSDWRHPEWTREKKYHCEHIQGKPGSITFYLAHSPGIVEFGDTPSKETRMSAWMVLHRIAHGVASRFSREGQREIRQCVKDMAELVKEHSSFPEENLPHRDFYPALLRLVTTMGSSRRHLSFNTEEVIHELIAQHISGGIRLQIPPEKIDLASITYHKHKEKMLGTLERKAPIQQKDLDEISKRLSNVLDKELAALDGCLIYTYP